VLFRVPVQCSAAVAAQKLLLPLLLLVSILLMWWLLLQKMRQDGEKLTEMNKKIKKAVSHHLSSHEPHVR
jgi:hypothetical protein